MSWSSPTPVIKLCHNFSDNFILENSKNNIFSENNKLENVKRNVNLNLNELNCTNEIE